MKRSLLIMLLVAGMPLLTNAQVITKVNDVAPFQEGLAGVQKGNAWGFIDADGKLIVDYRTDFVLPPNGKPVFSDGMCMIKEEKDGLILFGYIDTRGRTAIAAEYLAATPFENGYARVIKYYKEDTGTTNALGKKHCKLQLQRITDQPQKPNRAAPAGSQPLFIRQDKTARQSAPHYLLFYG